MCVGDERTATSRPSPFSASRTSSACSTSPRDSGPCDLPSKCSSASSTVSTGSTSFLDSFIVSAPTTPSYADPGKHLVLVDNNPHVKSDPGWIRAEVVRPVTGDCSLLPLRRGGHETKEGCVHLVEVAAGFGVQHRHWLRRDLPNHRARYP